MLRIARNDDELWFRVGLDSAVLDPAVDATLFIRTHADGFWGLVLEAPDAVDVTAFAQVLIAGNDEVIADGLGPSDPRIVALEFVDRAVSDRFPRVDRYIGDSLPRTNKNDIVGLVEGSTIRKRRASVVEITADRRGHAAH